MAAAAAYAASMEEELTCSVCFELFVDPNTPKELDCSHVICEICVNSLIHPGKSRRRQDRVVDCPECRKTTKVPEVAELKTNRRLRNLAEKHQKHVNSHARELEATNHSSGAAASSTTTTGSGDQNTKKKPDLTEDIAEMKCEEHKDVFVKYFCKTCDVIVCQTCIVLNHHESSCHHDIGDIDKVYKEKLKQLRTEIFKAEYDSETYNEEWSRAEDRQYDIMSYSYFRQEKIDQEFEGCSCDPPDYFDNLKAQVDEECEQQLYENQDRQEMLEQRASDLQELANDAQVLVDHATRAEFFQQYKQLIKKMSAIPRLTPTGPGLAQFGSLIKRLDLDLIILGLESCSLKDSDASDSSSGQDSEAANFDGSSSKQSGPDVVYIPSVFVSKEEPQQPPKQLPDSHQLFVGNLPQDASDHELMIFFAKYGNVVNATIHQTRNRRNFAFVTFDNVSTVEYLLRAKLPLFRGQWDLNLEKKKSKRRGKRNNYYR